jgi:hypothetical protein
MRFKVRARLDHPVVGIGEAARRGNVIIGVCAVIEPFGGSMS